MFYESPIQEIKGQRYLKITPEQGQIAIELYDTWQRLVRDMYSAGIKTKAQRVEKLKELLVLNRGE